MTDAEREPEGDGGLMVDEALEIYVPQKLQERLKKAQDRCPPPRDGDVRALEERNEIYLHSSRWVVFEALNRAFNVVWGALVGRLVSGELAGFVFDEYPIRSDSVRRRLPADLWQRALYDSSEINIDGVLYRDARIWVAEDLAAGAGAAAIPTAVGRKTNLKVLVPRVAAETPAATAVLDNPSPPRGAVKAAVEAMMLHSLMVGEVKETVQREFQKIRQPRPNKKPD